MTCPHCYILLDLQKHKAYGGFRLFLACPECDYIVQLNKYNENGKHNINTSAKTVQAW